MKIDLTCPVELWQYTMPSEGHPECGFVLNNLSDKVVVSVQVTLIGYAQGETLLFRQVERAQGLSAGAGERFSLSVLPTQWDNVQTIDLVIEKVWFDDATIWRRGSVPLTEYMPNTLPPGRRLDQLRFVAGPDAAGYPQEQAHVWVCVCGRANELRSDRCCRCERRRDTVFATCSRENVEQLIAVHEQKLIDVARAAREDASRLAEEREAAHLRAIRHKQTVRRMIIGACCLLVVVAVGLLWGLPALRYAKATTLLQNGQYDEARAALTELGGYGDARALLSECDYRQASALMKSDSADDLAQAVALYQTLSGYQDSDAQYQAALYQLGKIDMQAQRYDSASDAFLQLGSYQDSEQLVKQCQYLQADNLMQNQSYVAARILFADLGDYQDAVARVAECNYHLGVTALDTGDYHAAVTQLTAAGDTQDAPELLQRASYLLAETLQDAGQYEQAGLMYKQADDYEDAALKANSNLYELAKEKMTEGDYVKAAELFQTVIPYLDSETLAWDCVYQQALAAATSGADEQAVTLLETIPKHQQGATLLSQCRYRLAGVYAEAGELDKAIAMYELLGNYQDAPKLLETLRYQQAETAYTAGDYATAEPLYEQLGKYEDSADKLTACRYQLAVAALAAGRYQEAIEGFAALGKYQDSAKQLESATFSLALDLKTSGDLDTALALLQTLPDNTDARQQISDITLGEARKAQAAGDLEKASQLYLALGDYSDARDGYNVCQYTLATQKRDAGDMRAAAALFAALGDYQDAATQAEACAYEAYGQYAQPARTAYEAKDWLTVIQTLTGFDDSNLPADYRDLQGMYQQACYNYAEALYDQGKVYEALPYYQLIPDYLDVTTKKLQRRCYLILGQWESVDGERAAAFRTDGTCTLFGEELYFAINGYALETGKTADTLTITHKLTTLTDTSLSIRVLTGGSSYNAVYPLVRTSHDAAPLTDASQATATETPAATQTNAAEATVTPTLIPTATNTPAATLAPTVTPTATPKPTAKPDSQSSATGS